MAELWVVAGCLLANAILSGIEIAFVSVGKPHLRDLEKRGNREATRILRLRDNPERTLSVLQVGITLVGTVAAAVGGLSAGSSLIPYLETRFSLSKGMAEVITVLAVTIPYTYCSLILGELVPKSIALRNPMRLILASSRWLILIDRVLSPVVGLFEASTKSVLRLIPFNLRPEASGMNPVEAGTLVDLDTLSEEHRIYMINLFNIRQKCVRDVMVPWGEATTVSSSFSGAEVAAVIHDSRHTRLPVLQGATVIGVLNTKEFLTFRSAGADHWQSLVRDVVRLRANDSLILALKVMQEKSSHLGVIWAGNDPIGIVTMEDIFEEVIGEIYDEDDDGKLKRIVSVNRRTRPGMENRELPPRIQ